MNDYPMPSLMKLHRFHREAASYPPDALREYSYALLLVQDYAVRQMRNALRGKQSDDVDLWAFIAERISQMSILLREAKLAQMDERAGCAKAISITAGEIWRRESNRQHKLRPVAKQVFVRDNKLSVAGS